MEVFPLFPFDAYLKMTIIVLSFEASPNMTIIFLWEPVTSGDGVGSSAET